MGRLTQFLHTNIGDVTMQMTFAGMESVPHNHTPTSISAAKRVKANPSKSEEDRRKIYAYILMHDGATDREMELALHMDGSTLRPRRGQLVEAGRIVDSGRTRILASGNPAKIWVIA